MEEVRFKDVLQKDKMQRSGLTKKELRSIVKEAEGVATAVTVKRRIAEEIKNAGVMESIRQAMEWSGISDYQIVSGWVGNRTIHNNGTDYVEKVRQRKLVISWNRSEENCNSVAITVDLKGKISFYSGKGPKSVTARQRRRNPDLLQERFQEAWINPREGSARDLYRGLGEMEDFTN